MSLTRRFDGVRVLVTGGSRNIGRAMVERFAIEGAAVAVNGVVPGEAEAVAETLRADGSTAIGIDADVSDENDVDRLLTTARSALGGIDVLINNAAVPMLGRVPFFDLAPADWDRQFQVNARGTYLCTRAAARGMAPGGCVINISSIGATKAHRSAVAYDATKGAIEAFTRAVALELAPVGVRVNAIAPGAISNDWFEARDAGINAAESVQIPLGRPGTGAEVAGVAAFLASDDASYITGQVITLDGGLTAQARSADSEVDVSGPEPRP